MLDSEKIPLKHFTPCPCSFVFPSFSSLPSCWTKLWSYVEDNVVPGDIGENLAILAHKRNGFKAKEICF